MRKYELVLVNERDEPIGIMEKMDAHQKGVLHRAFSVFIFNSRGEMLLQQRAFNKYHSGGLWTNACCSHPGPGEEVANAAKRRLQEEMGFTGELDKIFEFVYKAEFDNGLTEHEFDHVFAGEYDGSIEFDKQEVMDYCYKSLKDIRHSLKEHPKKFTQWFHLAFPRIEEWWKHRYKNMAEVNNG